MALPPEALVVWLLVGVVIGFVAGQFVLGARLPTRRRSTGRRSRRRREWLPRWPVRLRPR